MNKDEMKNAERLTWFHLDDLEGCQLSVLFVSCLIFPQKTNIDVAVVSTTHFYCSTVSVDISPGRCQPGDLSDV